MSEFQSIPTHIVLDNRPVPFHELHDQFANSTEGQMLATQVRWDRYRWTRDENGEMFELITKSEWNRLLRADANNLHHMPHTYGMARWILSKIKIEQGNNPSLHPDAQFSIEEMQVVLAGAIVHDRQEFKHGDVTFDHKNDNTHIAESETLSIMLGINPVAENEDEAQAVLRQIVDMTNTQNREVSKLGRVFNTIEHLGYLRTGLNAWHISQELPESSDLLRINLHWLTQNVLLNTLPTLIYKARIYPPIEDYLQMSKKIIMQAFANIDERSFECYNQQEHPDDPLKYQEKFRASQLIWEQYVDLD